MSHSFEEKTFGHLTYCDHCKQLLWGVRKQGFQCKGCGYTCHKKCSSSATKCPSAVPTGFLDDNTTKDSRAEKYLRQLKQRTGSEDAILTPSSSSSSSTTAKVNPAATEASVQESTLQHIRAITTSDKFQKILADAATNEEELVNTYLANQAALNPQITAKNFTRFVLRCGPVFAFRDELLLLVSWKNRVDTLVSLIIYCVICIYPKLALFVPHAILIYFILSNYPKKRQQAISKKEDKKMKKEKEKDESEKSNTNSTNNKKKPLEEKKNGASISSTTADIPSLFPFNLTTLFQPASDESPEYLRNLQNIQNTMGEFSDIYDWIILQSNHFNWSSELETMRILQAILASTFLLSLVVYVVPVNMIFLFGGLMVYGVNTRFAKYVLRELKPYMVQSGKRQVEGVKEWYMALENKLEDQEYLQEISVYENQRWWPMRGYLHEMVENERSPWSDFTGRVYLPIITEIPAPKGYQWKETSEWELDMTGPWVDDYLEIEISTSPDNNGWIYSDDNWEIATPQIEPVDDDEKDQHKETMTRRRRWVRECEKV